MTTREPEPGTADSAESGASRPAAHERVLSLTLLDEVMADALDPGYADARRARTGEPDAMPPGERPAAAARRAFRPSRIALVVVMLVVGFVGTLTVIDVRREAPEAAAARAELAAQVEARTAATDARVVEVRSLRAEVDSARDDALASTRTGRERTERLNDLALVAGTVPVTGPGVRVTVDDAPSEPTTIDDTGPDLGQVQDRDLQIAVNGLWAAGAEAIAVNGYRLTARTAIRSAGEAVLVDFRPVAPPYVIDAIGDPQTLEARFLDGPGGTALDVLSATYGIRFDTETVDELSLPAATGTDAADTGSRGSGSTGPDDPRGGTP